MQNCVMCGAQIPDNQGSKTCSVCYGDPYHGKDGYLLRIMEDEYERELAKQAEIAADNELAERNLDT